MYNETNNQFQAADCEYQLTITCALSTHLGLGNRLRNNQITLICSEDVKSTVNVSWLSTDIVPLHTNTNLKPVLNIDKHTLITQGVGAGVAQYLVECMTPYMYGSTILLTTSIRKYLIKNILNSHSS